MKKITRSLYFREQDMYLLDWLNKKANEEDRAFNKTIILTLRKAYEEDQSTNNDK